MYFMKTKKALLAVLLVAVLVAWAAGDSSARERGGRGRGSRALCACVMEGENGARERAMGRAMGRGGFRFNISEAPQEIQEKWTEAQRIASELRLELGRDTIDRGRAMELRHQHRALMQEVSDWRFMQRLDALTDPERPE